MGESGVSVSVTVTRMLRHIYIIWAWIDQFRVLELHVVGQVHTVRFCLCEQLRYNLKEDLQLQFKGFSKRNALNTGLFISAATCSCNLFVGLSAFSNLEAALVGSKSGDWLQEYHISLRNFWVAFSLHFESLTIFAVMHVPISLAAFVWIW